MGIGNSRVSMAISPPSSCRPDSSAQKAKR
jgi:hypothetical protein